jgi:hypothetical protein
LEQNQQNLIYIAGLKGRLAAEFDSYSQILGIAANMQGKSMQNAGKKCVEGVRETLADPQAQQRARWHGTSGRILRKGLYRLCASNTA